MNIRILSIGLVAIFSLAFAVKFTLLANGNILNFYPYISDDGYDWYTEGVYLIKSISNPNLPALPVLRPPVFVLICSIDYLFGESGIIIALVIGTSNFLIFYLALRFIEIAREQSKNVSTEWYLIPLVIGFTVYSLGFTKPFLLSDTLALALSMLAPFVLVTSHTSANKLILACFIACIASITQTYALLPYLVFGVLNTFNSFRNFKTQKWWALSATIFPIIFLMSVSSIWRESLPHVMTPNNFNLLKFVHTMTTFYINTWIYYLLPYLWIFFVPKWYKFNWDKKNKILACSFIVVIFFATFCYFYQWREARFTYYFLPWLVIFISSTTTLIRSSAKGLFIVISIASTVAFVPSNYWIPELNSLHFFKKSSWPIEFFLKESVDRKLNETQIQTPDNNEFIKASGGYIRSSIKIYQELKLLN